MRRRGIERGKLLMGSCVVCMVRTHNKRHATHAVKKAPMRPRKIPLSGRRRPASPRIRPEERSYVGLFVAHTWSAGLDGGTGICGTTCPTTAPSHDVFVV